MKIAYFSLVLALMANKSYAKIDTLLCETEAQSISDDLQGGAVQLSYRYTAPDYSRVEIYRASGLAQGLVIIAKWDKNTHPNCRAATGLWDIELSGQSGQ